MTTSTMKPYQLRTRNEDGHSDNGTVKATCEYIAELCRLGLRFFLLGPGLGWQEKIRFRNCLLATGVFDIDTTVSKQHDVLYW